MKKTMLTYKTLDRFETENRTEHYTEKEIEAIEHAAYVANMNSCSNEAWTDEDIYSDFMRVLGIHHITVERKASTQEEAEGSTQAAEKAGKDENTMNYKMVNNEQFGSIEIYFEGKPAEEIRDALKALHFRWNGKKSCWYGFAEPEQITAALSGCTADQSTADQSKADQSTAGKTSGAGKKSAVLPSLWERCNLDSLPGYATENDMKQAARDAAKSNGSSYDKEAAKIIRTHLKARFPEVKFSVTSGGAGWLDNVDIHIKSSPYEQRTVAGDPCAIDWRNRHDHKELSPELDAVLKYAKKLHDCFDADDGDYYADYGAHHDLYGDAGVYWDYTQTEPTAAQLADMEAFRAAKAEREKEEEERRRIEFEEEQKRREIEAEESRKRYEEEQRKVAEIEKAITVEDIPEAEQVIYYGLKGAGGKEANIEELLQNLDRTGAGQVSRRVDFPSVDLFNDFCNMFLYDFSFLAGKGKTGTYDSRVNSDNFKKLNKEQRGAVEWLMIDCVAVSVCGEIKLVIDPEGFNYARYVYLMPEDVKTENATEVEQAEAETERKSFYFPATISEQVENVKPGDTVTFLYLDPWIMTVQAITGTLESAEPCRYAQYNDAAKISIRDGRKAKTEYIHTGSSAVIFHGILPEIPPEMKYKQVSENVQLLNFSGAGSHDFIKECIEYYIALGYVPAVDTVQR